MAKDLKSPPFAPTPGVPVSDALAAGSTVDVKKAALVCLPADVASAGITDTGAYQCCDKISGDKLEPAVRTTSDSIGGSLSVSLSKRDLDCEPCTLAP